MKGVYLKKALLYPILSSPQKVLFPGRCLHRKERLISLNQFGIVYHRVKSSSALYYFKICKKKKCFSKTELKANMASFIIFFCNIFCCFLESDVPSISEIYFVVFIGGQSADTSVTSIGPFTFLRSKLKAMYREVRRTQSTKLTLQGCLQTRFCSRSRLLGREATSARPQRAPVLLFVGFVGSRIDTLCRRTT